jgi:hypothetical protein
MAGSGSNEETNLVLEPGVLDAELLLLVGHLAKDGGVAAVGADDVADGGLQAVVLALEALVLGAEEHVVGAVLLRLHLRAPVLEPELDLPGLEPQLLAQLQPLLVVRVRALLEQPAGMAFVRPRNAWVRAGSIRPGKKKVSILTLPSAGSGARCGGGTASSCRCWWPAADSRRRPPSGVRGRCAAASARAGRRPRPRS